MEFKVILYILIGIGYFLYRQYQKLQADALERKGKIEVSQKPEPTKSIANPKPVKTYSNKATKRVYVSKRKTEPQHVASDVVVNNLEQGMNPWLEIKNENEYAEALEKEVQKNDFQKSDLQQMILWSEILGKPLSLRN